MGYGWEDRFSYLLFLCFMDQCLLCTLHVRNPSKRNKKLHLNKNILHYDQGDDTDIPLVTNGKLES